jgi:S1-C subfamily serine protease
MFEALPFGRDFMNMGIVYDASNQTWTIRSLSEDSALYSAGLREGDVIQQFDGEAYDPAGLRGYLEGLDADVSVALTVERDGETQEIAVPREVLDSIMIFGLGRGDFQFFGPDGREFNLPFSMGQMMGGGRLGVQYITLDEQAAQENNVSLTEGALLTEVIAGSPAAEAGLRADDVVTAVNGEPVDAERTLGDRLIAYEPGDTISLDVARGGETLTIDVTLGQPEMSDMLPFFNQGGRGFQFFGPDGREFPFQFELPEPAQPMQSNL